MGAETFDCTFAGVDAKEAYQEAVKDAQYWHGHAGYTGTIAEKSGYVMITNTKMSADDAEELGAQLIESCDDRIDDKWGPAGCIPLEDGRYYFFGWASS
jgi:hypothetical protein